jgi:tetratricopeptide (TPR) repeat protein
LQPVLELLRLFFGISATDDAATARAQIAQRVLPVGRTFEADLPLLYEFLGVADVATPASRLDPKTRHARLFDIIRHVIRQSGAATAVIIIEDLHWLDEASEEFIEMLVDAIAGTRTMLVLNFRPSYTAPWMKWAHYEPLSLSELRPTETISLVEELVGDRPELGEIRQRVSERSGGNPFFAEELVRSLAERGALFGDTGDYRLGIQSGEAALPPTIEAVIGARIDRLGEVEKAVLQVGAIIGKEFPFPVLEQVLGTPSPELDAVLVRLCGAELIQERAGGEARWFAFRHPLIQEVAYATQLKSRRSTLHASVASAMGAFYKDRLDEFAGLLAYHYDAAGQSLDAARYGARAALWVGTTNAAEAAKHWHKVRLLLQTQPRSPTIDELRIMASAQIAMFGWRGGMAAADAKAFIDEALAWARETQNSMIHLLLAADGRVTVATGGSADVYVDRLKEALSLLQEQTGIGRAATLNAFLSQAYNLAGMLNDALAANTVALQGISRIERADEEFLGFNVEHWVRSLRGRILVRLGRFSEAEECLDMMLKIEQTLPDPAIQFIPHFAYVDLAGRGDAELAMQHAFRVTEIADKSQIPYLSVYASAFRGTARSIARDFDAAVRDFRESLASARKAKAALEYEPEILASLADCYRQMRNFDQAEAAAMEAIEVARQRSARLAECRASITCGAAILAGSEPRRNLQAMDLFGRAEQLIRSTGAKIYEPLLMRERARVPTPAS